MEINHCPPEKGFAMPSSFTLPSRFWKLSMVLAFGATAAAALRAEDKVSLRLEVVAGQAWKFDQSSDRQMNSTATAGGQTQTNTNQMHMRRVGTIEVLTANAGRPASVRIAYGRACENRMEANGHIQTPAFPFAGQTVIVSRAEDGSIQSDFRGQADASFMDELK